LYGGALQQEKPAWLTYAASGNIAFCLKTDTDVVTLTFDLLTPKINEFPRLIVEHLCVKFGDHHPEKPESGENPTE